MRAPLAFARAFGLSSLAVMPLLSKIKSKIKSGAESLELQIEMRFEKFARDQRVLAFVGQSLNHASQLRLDLKTFKREVASFRARAKR